VGRLGRRRHRAPSRLDSNDLLTKSTCELSLTRVRLSTSTLNPRPRRPRSSRGVSSGPPKSTCRASKPRCSSTPRRCAWLGRPHSPWAEA
jgi:hypothetical protein